MKITKSQLRQIIKEESSRVLSEQNNDGWWVDEMTRVIAEIKKLHDAVDPRDLENFEGLFKTNVSMNFPWICADPEEELKSNETTPGAVSNKEWVDDYIKRIDGYLESNQVEGRAQLMQMINVLAKAAKG